MGIEITTKEHLIGRGKVQIMICQMYSRIELRFWDWVIPLLSHSRRLQNILKQLQPLVDHSYQRKFGLRSLLIAAIGFGGGAFLAVLIR